VADLNKFLGSGGKNLKLHEQRDSVRGASEAELHEALETSQTELLNLRTQAMMQQMANPMRIRQVRKMIARIHTELNARSQRVA
jgi:large subunit ribosomal protein L29